MQSIPLKMEKMGLLVVWRQSQTEVLSLMVAFQVKERWASKHPIMMATQLVKPP